jgi:hypothetical protein
MYSGLGVAAWFPALKENSEKIKSDIRKREGLRGNYFQDKLS